jgi:hypothetical protein
MFKSKVEIVNERVFVHRHRKTSLLVVLSFLLEIILVFFVFSAALRAFSQADISNWLLGGFFVETLVEVFSIFQLPR